MPPFATFNSWEVCYSTKFPAEERDLRVCLEFAITENDTSAISISFFKKITLIIIAVQYQSITRMS